MAKIYDFKTKKVSSIPASELAPGMVEAEVKGVGRVWVNTSQMKESPFRHPPFTEDLRDYLRQIKAALDEVYPKPLEFWEDGFRRDQNAEREIAVWMHIASTYRRCTEDRSFSPAQRRELFNVIMTCSTSPREHLFEVLQLSTISREEAERAVEVYFSPQK